MGMGKTLEIYSFEGEVKNKIIIDSQFGEFSHFQSNERFLLTITNNNHFAAYDISRREIKQILNFRKFEKNKQLLGEIRDAAINSKGSFIVFLSDNIMNQEFRVPDTLFYVYDLEYDTFVEFEISPNRIPIEIIWDYNDQRIFGIQTEYARDNNEEVEIKDDKKKEYFGSEFFILFYTSEYGIKKQESHRINREIQGLFALSIPSIYFIVANTVKSQNHSLLEKKFQFFQGLEKIDETLKLSLIEFSILMSSGKIDEAYKIVKNIKNPIIWENMAQICVKTKRLDVLEVCISNMRFSRGIKAVI
jgi:intraflagellar transport protein 140